MTEFAARWDASSTQQSAAIPCDGCLASPPARAKSAKMDHPHLNKQHTGHVTKKTMKMKSIVVVLLLLGASVQAQTEDIDAASAAFSRLHPKQRLDSQAKSADGAFRHQTVQIAPLMGLSGSEVFKNQAEEYTFRYLCAIGSIVSGKVVSSSSHLNKERTYVITRTVFEIDRVFRSNISDQTKDGAIKLFLPGGSVIDAGQEYSVKHGDLPDQPSGEYLAVIGKNSPDDKGRYFTFELYPIIQGKIIFPQGRWIGFSTGISTQEFVKETTRIEALSSCTP